MVKVYGADVNIQIDAQVFPTQQEIAKIDEMTPGATHGWFDSSVDNTKLHYVSWLPGKEGPKGIVVFMHGVASHCNKGTVINGRKLATSLMVEDFLKQGIAVYAFDRYGHGFSEGYRTLIPQSWKNDVADGIRLCKLATEQHSSKIPLFVSGESYGGCLALHIAKTFQDDPSSGPSNFDSCLLVSPAIVGDIPGFPVYHILRYILAPLFPKWIPFFMPHPISPDRIWRDKDVLKQRASKRYMEMGIDQGGRPYRLRTAVNVVLSMEDCRANLIPNFKVPFCVVHGTDDIGVPMAGSELLTKCSQTPQDRKEFYPLDGALHDVFADPRAEEAMGHWVSFVQKRMKEFKA